jgi:hypothetical protein
MQQRQIMPGHAANLVTAEEFARIPDDNYHHELVEGRVVRVSPPGSRHGALIMRIGALLHQHVESQRAGAVLVTAGFKIAADPGHSSGAGHCVHPCRTYPLEWHPRRLLAGTARSRNRDPIARRSAHQHSGQGCRLPRARGLRRLGR